MKRLIYNKLIEWENRKEHKPLILLGARQVGKTYILKEFGKNEFKNLVYVNCHGDDFAKSLFRDLSVQRIVTEIERYYETKIVPGETLLVFDEIQEVHNGISSLKYFNEDFPSLHVAVAGSLLGISLREDESYPVGKVTTMRMYPMTFAEYLLACERPKLLEALQNLEWDSLSVMDDLLVELLRQYYFTGGMPEAVKKYIETQDVELVREVQHEILDAYERDIAKHTKPQVARIHQVWESIPTQLARENKKFIFGETVFGVGQITCYDSDVLLERKKDMLDIPATISWLTDHGVTVLGAGRSHCTGYLLLSTDVPLTGILSATVPLPERRLLILNQIPEEKRLEDLSFLQIAIMEGKQAEANGGYYHPAANAAFDRLSNGCSSRIQYEALLANVSLAEKLTENSMETYPFV